MVASLATIAGHMPIDNTVLKPCSSSSRLQLLDQKTQASYAYLQSTAGKLLSVTEGTQTLARDRTRTRQRRRRKARGLAPELKKLPQAIEAALKQLEG